MCIVIFYDQAGLGIHTIFLRDFSLLEGNTGSQLANFTMTLDAPATERVTFQDGPASGLRETLRLGRAATHFR